MLIISPSIVLNEAAGISLNNPLICWNNILTVDNVVADFENVLSPAANLANPATDLRWKSTSTATQYITVSLGAEEIDFVGIARHNLGTTESTLSIEANSGSGFVQQTTPAIPGDDEPILFRFTPGIKIAVRLKIVPGSTGIFPFIAVMFVGRSLALQRRIYVGHTPLKFGRDFEVTTGMSESNEYLGRIITGESRSSVIELQNLTPSWYREKLDPFISRAGSKTFFWAWRPSGYPDEVGYCWVTGNPRPQNQRTNGMMSISIPIGGIA